MEFPDEILDSSSGLGILHRSHHEATAYINLERASFEAEEKRHDAPFCKAERTSEAYAAFRQRRGKACVHIVI